MKRCSRREFIRKTACGIGGILGGFAGLEPVFAREKGFWSDMRSRLFGDRVEKPAVGSDFVPGYLELHREGALRHKGRLLWEMMESCRLCPRQCGVNRLKGEKGICRASSRLRIAAAYPHFGEEPPLVGSGGSGAVFFAHCGLRCVFCINFDVSIQGKGDPYSIEALSRTMLRLQARGCHNINCVTPTHYLPHILLALDRAASRGLRLPLVYNTSGWERRDILEILDGAVDIYLPDFKFWDPEAAARYSPGAGSENYPETARDALLEMHRQAGRALPAEDGLIERGLMIRHLVMPNRVAGTREVLGWIARHLPKDTYVNLMAQYRPFYKAFDYPEIARPLTEREYRECVEWVREFGLSRVCLQA